MIRKFIPIASPRIGASERIAVDRVLRSGRLSQGSEVALFEQEFSSVVGGWTCVAVNSGTSGLHLGLLASGIGPGDEVIVPSFTFAATANSVVLAGATPVFVDVNESDYCLDPDAVRAAISPKTAAIMPVHLYGHPAPMDRLVDIATKYGLAIFEDASQAHGASLRGQPVGTFGDFAVFSFYPTKNMTSGEGGMVSVKSEGLARKIRLLRNQGMLEPYKNEIVGLNNRMTDIHAAIGRVQLRNLPKWTQKRIKNAALLNSAIRKVLTPTTATEARHVFHQYTIRVLEGRDEFVSDLRNRWKVGTGIYYPIPNHQLESLKPFGIETEMPVTERLSREVVSLPVHPSLRSYDLRRISRATNLAAL